MDTATQRARGEGEATFRTLFEQSLDAIAVCREGVHVFVNPAYVELFGYDAAPELLGKPVCQLIAPGPIPSDGRVRGCYEVRGLRRNGSEFDLEAKLSGFEWDGRPHTLVIGRDVTKRKQAEDQVRLRNVQLEQRVEEGTAALAAANKELEAFSYSVSHDLRAPLRAIGGFAQIIREDYGHRLDKEALELFSEIGINAQKMGKLIEDLVQFAQVAGAELQRCTVNMAELVRSVIEELTPLEAQRPMRIAVGDLPQARGDAAMLRQVWVNLISNALKFTRGRSSAAEIEIAGDCAKDRVAYFIRDNGVGFDAQYAPKLFQVFQRLHRAEDFDGTGVGLAIVQRIVHRHGGQVWAEGKVNQGAAFHFTLPAV